MRTYIDLFSGPGGLCTGFKSAGFKPLIAVELSDWTILTYARNHDVQIIKLEDIKENIGKLEKVLDEDGRTVLIHGDITQVTNEIISEILLKKFKTNTVDVVVGGAPCESFSLAGKREAGDERDVLFESIVRIGSAVDANYLMFENVKGLLSKKRAGKTGGHFEYVLETFEKNGYPVVERDPKKVTFLASDYGVPQNRERIFVVGYNLRKVKENKFTYPIPTTPNRKITAEEALMNLPVLNSGEGSDLIEYNCLKFSERLSEFDNEVVDFHRFMLGIGWYNNDAQNLENFISCHKAVNHREKMVKRMELIKEGEGMRKAAERLRENGREELIEQYFPKKLYEARNRRLKRDEPSFTVTSHCLDEMIHPTSHRALTPREAARLQTFPDWYKIEGPYVKFHSDPEQDKYEQIGDAIPVLLAYHLAKEFKKALDLE